VIDIENNNVSYTNLPNASTVEVDHNNSKLSFYDLSDLLANNLLVHLVFYIDTV
jgi:hypothetical protein